MIIHITEQFYNLFPMGLFIHITEQFYIFFSSGDIFPHRTEYFYHASLPSAEICAYCIYQNTSKYLSAHLPFLSRQSFSFLFPDSSRFFPPIFPISFCQSFSYFPANFLISAHQIFTSPPQCCVTYSISLPLCPTFLSHFVKLFLLCGSTLLKVSYLLSGCL